MRKFNKAPAMQRIISCRYSCVKINRLSWKRYAHRLKLLQICTLLYAMIVTIFSGADLTINRAVAIPKLSLHRTNEHNFFYQELKKFAASPAISAQWLRLPIDNNELLHRKRVRAFQRLQDRRKRRRLLSVSREVCYDDTRGAAGWVLFYCVGLATRTQFTNFDTINKRLKQ